MEGVIGSLLSQIPENEDEYTLLLYKELKDFVQKYIENESNEERRKRNWRWLMNWIGKSCYPELKIKKSGECLNRKNWIQSAYTEKEESLPFLDSNETVDYLKSHKEPFVSRLSSTKPGEITIQYIDEKTNDSPAKRFNYYTQKSNRDEKLEDYLNVIIDKKNQYNKKKIDKKTYQNYYEKPLPYETIETVVNKSPPKKKGIYLEPGEFSKRAIATKPLPREMKRLSSEPIFVSFKDLQEMMKNKK